MLPFSLLIRKTEDNKPQYLVEWKPLHAALSATVFAELKKERRTTGEKNGDVLSLAAFGDPIYPYQREDDKVVGVLPVSVHDCR